MLNYNHNHYNMAEFQELNNTLAVNGGAVTTIINDNYLLVNMSDIFPANETFVEDLAVVSLQLQPAKSQCYIREGLQGTEWDTVRRNIPNGVLKDSNNDEVLVEG